MAIGIGTDFKIYNEQINGAVVETVMQFIDTFNAQSRGAIQMTTEAMRGDLDYESFFLEGGDVEVRDPNDVTAHADNAILQEEVIRVKVHRDFRRALTRNQWLRIGQNPEQFSRVYGLQIARKMMKEELNTGISAVSGAISGQSALLYDASAATLVHTALNTGISKFGDAYGDIVCFVMHSKPWFDLVGSAITLALLEVGGVAVNEGTTGTLGRPVIITDSPSLVVTGSPTKYVTLGLTAGAVQLVDTETPYTADQEITGLGNIVRRLQTEWAYNLGVRGFKYNVSAGLNPNAAAVALSTNWVKVATDNKSLAGVRILSL